MCLHNSSLGLTRRWTGQEDVVAVAGLAGALLWPSPGVLYGGGPGSVNDVPVRIQMDFSVSKRENSFGGNDNSF